MTHYLLPPDTAQELLTYLAKCPCGEVINLVLKLNQLETTEVEKDINDETSVSD